MNTGRLARATVLIVEDDRTTREIWTRMLADRDYDVSAVPDAESAVLELPRQPCVAICDIHLPGRDGLWLIDKIQSTSPTTAILIVTADPDVPATSRLQPSIAAYLVKPVPVAQLVAAVTSAVELAAARRAARQLR